MQSNGISVGISGGQALELSGGQALDKPRTKLLFLFSRRGEPLPAFAAAYLTTNVTQRDVAITLSQPTPPQHGARDATRLEPQV